MNKTIKSLLTATVILGLLTGCARTNPHPMDMTAAVQSAKTKADHERLVAHYEQASKDAEAQVEAHEKLLDQYKAQSYLYGKRAATIQSHCEALIRFYQQIAQANAQLAELHRQMESGAQ